MTYRGIRKDYITVLRGRKRPPWAPIQRNILTVPGFPGGYLQNTETGPRPLEVPVLIQADSFSDLQKLKEDLAAWLISDTPQELIFDDEPDRVYFAVVDGSLDLEELVRWGQGAIHFICPDPYKYGPIKSGTFTSEINSISYQGTAESYPIFRATVREPITYFDIVSDQGYMRIGQVPSVDDNVFEPYTTILHDELASTVGWTQANFPLDPNVLATLTSDGVIASDGSSFLVQNYGTGSSLKWYGPGVVKSLSEQLENYRIAFRCRHEITEGNSFGRTELYLLDSNSIPIAKLSLTKDGVGNVSTPEVSLFDVNLNKRRLIRVQRETIPNWKNVDGYFLFEKNGTEFTVSAMKTKGYGGRVEEKFEEIFNDQEGIYQRKVAYIGIVMMKYTTYPSLNRNRAESILVQKINQQEGIPYIAFPGDQIEINFKDSDIRINGEDRKDLKDFGASFFPLKRGENIIQISPFDKIENIEVEWREAYL
jgi:predicted phage tail component-like protein